MKELKIGQRVKVYGYDSYGNYWYGEIGLVKSVGLDLVHFEANHRSIGLKLAVLHRRNIVPLKKKEHVGPKEIWVNVYPTFWNWCSTKTIADDCARSDRLQCIRYVRAKRQEVKS